RSLTMRPLKESLRGAGTSSAPHRAVRQPSAGLPAKLIFPNGSPDGLDFVGGERRNAAFIPELVRTGGPSVHGGSLPSIILTGGLNVETSDDGGCRKHPACGRIRAGAAAGGAAQDGNEPARRRKIRHHAIRRSVARIEVQRDRCDRGE